MDDMIVCLNDFGNIVTSIWYTSIDRYFSEYKQNFFQSTI